LNDEEYLKSLAAEIGELQRRPARLTQSAEESSLDAWLEKYAYYRLPVRSISYYNKGNLLGILLDLQVREATHGSDSIRDVFLWMNQHYALKGEFFPDTEGVRLAAETVTHTDLKSFFDRYVAGAEEIPWDDFFKSVGLHLARSTIGIADPGFVTTRNFDAGLMVASLTPGGPAESAGLAVGDLILQINGQNANDGFAGNHAEVCPGEVLRLRVRNTTGDHDLQWTLGTRQEVELKLVNLDKITPEQKARRKAWVKGEVQAVGAWQ
jgi:predicted metalloprotease with PDZ domain